MFGLGPATRIYLAAGATDMRKGFEGLYGLVRDRLSCEPLSGHLFLFCNAQRNRLKVLVWDGTGLWVCAKLPPARWRFYVTIYVTIYGRRSLEWWRRHPWWR